MTNGESLELGPGILVTNPRMPSWGPGKILKRDGPYATVLFRDLPELEATKRMSVATAGLVALEDQADRILEARTARAGRRARKAGTAEGADATSALPFDQALTIFTHEYPALFADKKYLEEERAYKDKAHALYVELLGDGKGASLLKAGKTDVLAEHLGEIAGSINLATWIELAAFNDGLTDGPSTGHYAEALFAFIDSDPDEGLFDDLSDAVASLPTAKGKSAVDKWTITTLVPFIAAPTRVMFLKPMATQAIAAGLNYDLLYETRPQWQTYERLMTLGNDLLTRLRPHGAVDFIDVQTFIWRSHKLWMQ